MDRQRVYRIEMGMGRVRYGIPVREFGLGRIGISDEAEMRLDLVEEGSRGGK